MIQDYLPVIGVVLLCACGKDSAGRSSDFAQETGVIQNQREGSVTLHINPVQGDTNRVLNARGIVRAQSPSFRRCYEAAVLRDPMSRGRLELGISLSESGELEEVNENHTGVLDEDFVACVIGRARILRFDPPRGGGAKIVVPMLFGMPH